MRISIRAHLFTSPNPTLFPHIRKPKFQNQKHIKKLKFHSYTTNGTSYHTGSRLLHIHLPLLFQWILWNLKGISRDKWCMLLGIFVSHIGRGSPFIPILLFFTILMVLVYVLQNEFQPFLRFDYSFLSSAYAFLSFCE